MTRPDWPTITPAERANIIKGAVTGITHSAAQLASLFENCTRNAILGFYHRGGGKKFNLPPLPSHNSAPSNKRKTRSIGAQGMAFKIAQARKDGLTLDEMMSQTKIEGTIPKAVAAPASEPIPFIDAKPSTCRWPLWDKFESAETSHICGAHVHEDSPWCEFHHQRAHGQAA